MFGKSFYGVLADLLFAIHWIIAGFVVFGFFAIVVGSWRNWKWVGDPLFRVGHLATIGYVASRAWLGIACPLTVWENELRVRAGETVYQGSFVQHWLEELLHMRLRSWMFNTAYTIGALVCILAWFVALRKKRAKRNGTDPVPRHTMPVDAPERLDEPLVVETAHKQCRNDQVSISRLPN